MDSRAILRSVRDGTSQIHTQNAPVVQNVVINR